MRNIFLRMDQALGQKDLRKNGHIMSAGCESSACPLRISKSKMFKLGGHSDLAWGLRHYIQKKIRENATEKSLQ